MFGTLYQMLSALIASQHTAFILECFLMLTAPINMGLQTQWALKDPVAP